LKGILSLYQSFSLINNESYTINTNTNLNKWFELSYSNIYNLATMSYDVYEKLDINFNKTIDISKDNDTVKAYLFSSEDKKTHVISIKGTSIIFGNSLKIFNSVYNDKFNDNLFYSCCFYKESSLYNKIDELLNEKCWDAQKVKGQLILSSKAICKQKCFSLMNKHVLNYISITYNIIKQLKSQNIYNIDFENDEIIFTGHSLGGSLAVVMGILYNKPAVSFESPGIKNYLLQSNILKDYNKTIDSISNIYNFGHNADTIFTGKCVGKFSLCYIGGYNIETKCHIGKVCEYDAINKLNISESIFTHKLKYIIDKIIPHWENDFPICEDKKECNDCENWIYT